MPCPECGAAARPKACSTTDARAKWNAPSVFDEADTRGLVCRIADVEPLTESQARNRDAARRFLAGHAARSVLDLVVEFRALPIITRAQRDVHDLADQWARRHGITPTAAIFDAQAAC